MKGGVLDLLHTTSQETWMCTGSQPHHCPVIFVIKITISIHKILIISRSTWSLYHLELGKEKISCLERTPVYNKVV